jgi:hypothetical protein
MVDVLFLGTSTRYKTEEVATIEYFFSINQHPIPVALVIYRSHNNKTYDELLSEACNYAVVVYTLGQSMQRGGLR